MKPLLFFISFILGMTASADHSGTLSHDHPSVHGMLVFGTSRIYLSHLPMFHSPHDYQVIVEAELDPNARASYLATQAMSPEKVFTLVPEVFVLPEMIEHPRAFKATLFKGHFERGGEVIQTDVTMTIKKVLYFKKFVPEAIKPVTATFLLFGTGKELFLAHVISSRPDFDQVLSVKAPPQIADRLKGNQHLVATFPGSSNEIPLNPTAQIRAEIESNNQGKIAFDLNLETEIYREHGDLSF